MAITAFTCGQPEKCPKTGKDHDWSGPEVTRELPSGAVECGATCKDCGVYFGDWMLWNLP